MAGFRTITRGETIVTIALGHGFFPQTVWRHEKNAPLRESGRDIHHLAEGDRVFVPDPIAKEVSVPSGRRYRFRRRGIPETVRIRLATASGRPRGGLRYILYVDGCCPLNGITDAGGTLTHHVPPLTESGRLVVTSELNRIENYDLLFSHLEPAAVTAGIQQRLNRLGFVCGRDDGVMDFKTQRALAGFQKQQKLFPSGAPDVDTRAALERLDAWT